MKRSNPVAHICQAAIQVVVRDGLLAMTLDNVAKEAGVSKGGVMYHFANKEQLHTAMLAHFGEQLEQMLVTRVANDPHPRRRWVRAMLALAFSENSAEPMPADDPASFGDALSPQVTHRFMLAVLAAAVGNPGLLDPLRQLGLRIRERLLADPDDGLEPLLFWLALDGLFLWEFVGLIDRTDPLYRQIGAELQKQAETPSPSGEGLQRTRAPNAKNSLVEQGPASTAP